MTARRHPWAKRLRRVAGDEGGSVLIIALVMVFVVALIATAVLSYTGTSLTASRAVADSGKTLYAADGALDTAIRQIGADPNAGYNNTDARCSKTPASAIPTVCSPHHHDQRRGCRRSSARERTPRSTRSRQRRQPVGRTGQRGAHPRRRTRTSRRRAARSDGCGIFWWTAPRPQRPGRRAGHLLLAVAEQVDLLDALQQLCSSAATPAYKQSQQVRSPAGSSPTRRSSARATRASRRPGRSRSARPARSPVPDSSSRAPGPATPRAACRATTATDADFTDPGYFHKGQTAGLPGEADRTPRTPTVTGNPGPVPACGHRRSSRSSPVGTTTPRTLNNLFRTCANADGSGKDYWFMPGVYYFDFRNTTVTQGCGNVGVDADPGTFGFGDEDTSPTSPTSGASGARTSATAPRPRPRRSAPTSSAAHPSAPRPTRRRRAPCGAGRRAAYCWNPLPRRSPPS